MSLKQILVIEDDANIRDVLQLALNFEGYKVVTAKNGKEGLEILSKMSHPGLILLDLMMPVMNGWEFVDAFKKIKEFANIPIVVVSAYSEKARAIECNDFVLKPLELETLLSSVKKHFKENV